MISAYLSFTQVSAVIKWLSVINNQVVEKKRQMIKIIQRSKATRLKFDHDGVLSLKRTSELMRHYLILQVSFVFASHFSHLLK